MAALQAVILAASGAAQTASSPSPTPPPSLDPFCGASVGAMQWDRTTNSQAATQVSDAIVLALFAQSGESVDAHVTLLTDTEAYDVALPHVPLAGKQFDRVSPEIIVTLPKPAAVR